MDSSSNDNFRYVQNAISKAQRDAKHIRHGQPFIGKVAQILGGGAGGADVYGIDLTLKGGDAGGATGPCAYFYDVFETETGIQIGTDIQPVNNPHWWRRWAYGQYQAATQGLAIRAPQTGDGFVIAWINEIQVVSPCDSPSGELLQWQAGGQWTDPLGTAGDIIAPSAGNADIALKTTEQVRLSINGTVEITFSANNQDIQYAWDEVLGGPTPPSYIGQRAINWSSSPRTAVGYQTTTFSAITQGDIDDTVDWFVTNIAGAGSATAYDIVVSAALV